MFSECQGRKEEQAERGGWMEGGREGGRESEKGKGIGGKKRRRRDGGRGPCIC